MGYIEHDALVVTCWDGDGFDKAFEEAVRLKLEPIAQPEAVTNGFRTFAILSCGSKSGFGTKEDYEDNLSDFSSWLRNASPSYEWFWATYGSDPEQAIIRTSEWNKT